VRVPQLRVVPAEGLLEHAGDLLGVVSTSRRSTGVREDFARGSRYNNAARYLALDGDPQGSAGSTRTIVVVYSADGMVDILPPLYPPRDAAFLKRIVEDFNEAVRAPAQDLQEITRALGLVDRHCFYLSTQQCEALNDSPAEQAASAAGGPAFRRWCESPAHVA
jgi:hypothetical protein